MVKKILILLISLLIFYSCKKDSVENDNGKPNADFNYYDEIDRFRLVDYSTDPDDDPLSVLWSDNSDQVTIIDSTDKIAYINLSEISEPTNVEITLTIDDGQNQSSVVKTIFLPELSYIRKWGLGKVLDQEVSNNADYEWYIDQMNTGEYSGNNCGPSIVTMAIKWVNESFTHTAEDARNTYRTSGGWWYTGDIVNYLNLYSINNKTISLSNMDLLTDEIDNGNIVILCLDMYYISDEIKEDWRINKFYTTGGTGWGHFILLKGYKIVDGEVLFEFYDPYSFGKKYSDNSLKGIDRYYSGSDIDQSTQIWWDYAIVVSKNTFKTAVGLDISKIPNQSGR
jgi:hypothetical protein